MNVSIDYQEDVITHITQCEIVAKVREFSDVCIHRANCEARRGFTEYDDVATLAFQLRLSVIKYAVYPNGYDGSSTGGYVSVVIWPFVHHLFKNVMHNGENAELTCVLAVIDDKGSRKYPQSFVFFCEFSKPDPYRKFLIKNYIARSVLLNDPSKCIPNNTLTLHMDLILREYYPQNMAWTLEETIKNFVSEDEADGLKHDHLNLDSPLAKRLAEESRYFERLLIEKRSNRMRIPSEEFLSFLIIDGILGNLDVIKCHSLDEIFDVYVTADKYGIPTVIDACRCWLKLYLSTENVLEISNFADRFDDYHLKAAAGAFLQSKDSSNCDLHSQAMSISEGWKRIHQDRNDGYFFRRVSRDEMKNNINERDFFDFYA